ncbi:hypothetical protein V8E52_005630, partial [Russula decolorans]
MFCCGAFLIAYRMLIHRTCVSLALFYFLRLRGGKVTCPRLRVQVGHVALQHDIHAVAASPSTWSTGFSLISLPRGVESYRSCFHHGCPVGIIWKTGHRMYGSGCQHWQFFLIRFL